MRPTSSRGSRSRTVRIAGLLLAGIGAILIALMAVGLWRSASGGVPAVGPVSPAPEPTGSVPTVAPTDTATAVLDTATAVGETVTVQYSLPNGTRVRSAIPPATLAAAVTPGGGLDGAELARSVDPALLGVVRPAADARFRIVDHRVTIVPARVGARITETSLAADVASVLGAVGESRTVTLHPEPVAPARSTADARALGVTELVASYRQEFPPAHYRSVNIGTAARYISGTLLQPGQVFSMNDTIRERTPANGYMEGWIIGPDGVFTMALGGAVSTITTAMYNAAWAAGLQFVEHRAHSIYIARYPPGREATVSWGAFDMRFRNSLSHALFITVQVHPSSVEVFLWGTREWDRIGTVFGPWTDRVPYRTIRSSASGCTPQDGMDGFRITTWRTFIRGGREVRREEFRTRYLPSPRVVCVPPPAPSATVTPTVTPGPPTPSPTAVTPTAVDTTTSAASP